MDANFFGASGARTGPMVIAEVALAHDGSLGFAHAFIDGIADSGAHAVKFQTHIAEAESTLAEPWRVRFSPQDETRYGYWQRTGFTEPQWLGLREHAHQRGLLFISSPFSTEAVELLERIGVDAWKIPSGELSNVPMLERIAATAGPVILSSGMSDWDELDESVELFQTAGSDLAVLQCTSAYPCPPERVGLNMLAEIGAKYGVPTGLSDHSGTIYPSIAATALGASVLEVHVAFSRQMFGPDVPASVTFEELADLVQGVDFIGKSLAAPVNKNHDSQRSAELRKLFCKSIVALRDIPAGTVLTQEHLGLKKPGTGLPAKAMPDVLGRRLVRAVQVDEPLTLEHFAPLEAIA